MIATTVTTVNQDEIESLYHLAGELGAHTFRILPFVPSGRGRLHRELEVSPRRMRRITAWLLARDPDQGPAVAPMEFQCTFSPPPAEPASADARIGCDGAIAYCSVTSAGEVLPCNFFAGLRAESVQDHEFARIWQHSPLLNYFRSLKARDIHGPCSDCDWLATCRCSCIAANFAHGELFQSNVHCWKVAESGTH